MNWQDDFGGGFMNDSIAADEPQQLTSSVSVGGDDKKKSLAAVSIAQIMKFTRPNEGLILYGKKIYHSNLVGVIYEVLDNNPQKVHLLLDDYTSGGPLEVNHIIGDAGTPGQDPSLSMFEEQQPPAENGGEKRLCDLKVGDYIRCIGTVKYYQDKACFNAYHLKYIDDPNEVTMHTLEVIRDAMFYDKLQQNGGVMPTATDHGAATTGGTTSHHQDTNQDQNMANNNFGKLSTRDKHLLKFLREKGMEDGMSLDNIAKNFTAFSRKDIEESLNTLSAEGLCWQGDSDDVWCVNAYD